MIFAEAVLILSKTSVGELWKSRYKARGRGRGGLTQEPDLSGEGSLWGKSHSITLDIDADFYLYLHLYHEEHML